MMLKKLNQLAIITLFIREHVPDTNKQTSRASNQSHKENLERFDDRFEKNGFTL